MDWMYKDADIYIPMKFKRYQQLLEQKNSFRKERDDIIGCDIHVLVEEKKDGIWKPVEGSYEEGIDEWGGEKHPYINIGPYDTPFYFGRDYDSFAIMANVRNGYGFAGVDTGDGFEVIDEPRGIPVDASEIYQKVVEQWDGDGHSHSYLYLGELREWKEKAKTLTTKHRGVITLDSWIKRVKNGETGHPGTWCGDVSGSGVKTLSEEQAKEFVDSNMIMPDISYYVQIEWEETYIDSAVNLVNLIEVMNNIAEKEDLCEKCLRVCFFFDN